MPLAAVASPSPAASDEGQCFPMRIASLLAAMALAGVPLSSGAWQTIDGRVLQQEADEAIAGAEITVQLSAPAMLLRSPQLQAQLAVARSDARGRFQIDLLREFPGMAWDRVEAVTLIATREGFRARGDRIRRPRLARVLDLRLERDLHAAPLDPELSAKLDLLRAASGNTLFVVADGAQSAAAELRNLVLAGLGRAARQHISGFVMASPAPEIAVQTLDLGALAIDPAAPLGRVAQRLNALAIVNARLEVGAAPRGGRAVQSFSSTVQLGQGAAGLPVSFEFDDAVGLDGAGAVAEFERLFDARWARLAVIALGAREFALADRANDVQRLRALQQLLVQELRRTGRANAEFVPQLKALQRATEDAIRRQGPR